MTSDSGRLPKGENSRSEVECEASQSGGVAASPEHGSIPSADDRKLIEQGAVAKVWPRAVADNHANILTPRETEMLYSASDWAFEAANRLESLLSDRARLIELLQRVEPHLDAILCYASTMEEHEPNRLAYDIGAALKDERA